jgi:hypothetical protein
VGIIGWQVKKYFAIYAVRRLAQVGGQLAKSWQDANRPWMAGKRGEDRPRRPLRVASVEGRRTSAGRRCHSGGARLRSDAPARQAKSTWNLTDSSVILHKWLSGNGRWGVFSKYWMEIVKKMSNSAVTMGVKREPAFDLLLRRGKA